MNEQAANTVSAILVEAGLLEAGGEQVRGVTWDAEIAARCLRAAYAKGYQDAHTDEQPFPLLQATRAEREAWARLPV